MKTLNNFRPELKTLIYIQDLFETLTAARVDKSILSILKAPSEYLLVSQDKKSHFKTVSAALEKAEANSVILIQSVNGPQKIEINKPVALISLSESLEEQKSLDLSEHLSINSSKVLISGFYFTNFKQDIKSNFVIEQNNLCFHKCSFHFHLNDGELRKSRIPGFEVVKVCNFYMIDCELQTSESCVTVSSGKSIILNQCQFYSNNSPALLLDNKSSAQINSCTCISESSSGIVLKNGSKLNGSKITVSIMKKSGISVVNNSELILNEYSVENGINGILVLNNSRLEIKKGYFLENQNGIKIGDSSKAEINGCRFKKCKSGISIFNNGSGNLKNISAENCDDGINIYNTKEVYLSNCKISGSTNTGISFNLFNSGMIINSSFTDNYIHIKAVNSRLSFDNSKFFLAKTKGITAEQGSIFQFNQCTIQNSNNCQFEAKDNSEASFTNCEVSSGGEIGLIAQNQSTLNINNSAIFNNQDGGVFSFYKSSLKINTSQIHSNGKFGVGLYNNSSLNINNSRIFSNENYGIRCELKSTMISNDSTLYENSLAGIGCFDSSECTVNFCFIHSHNNTGIYIDDNSNGLIESSKINKGNHSGILISKKSTAKILNSELIKNIFSSVIVSDYSELFIEDCVIADNTEYGCGIFENSTALLNRINISGCRIGIAILKDNNIKIENSKVINNFEYGVYIKEGNIDSKNTDFSGNYIDPVYIVEDPVETYGDSAFFP